MKKLRSNKYKVKDQKGSSTLEILIAFAVFVISITAVILIVFGNQSSAVDTETNGEALYKAQSVLEDARALSRKDFLSVTSTSSTELSGSLAYNKELTVTDLTQCKKQATSSITWATSTPRPQKIELTTFFSDVPGMLAMGGDCAIDPPIDGWNPPVLFASDTINPGKFNALDVLQKIVYLGSDKSPYLFIADARTAYLGRDFHDPMIVAFSNSFNSNGKSIKEINDIDVYKDFTTNKVYAFIAMASSTEQLAVIDVTDINNPELKAKRQLSAVTAGDSTAWGWRIYYYDKKLYVTTQKTAGPELHVFNVSDPTNPAEIGSMELNTTVNDFVVRDNLGYFAVDKVVSSQLLVYNISNLGTVTEIVGARGSYSGNEAGRSLFLVGNKLYFGRDKTSSGNEFYILDVTNPAVAVGGMPILGPSDPNKEMDTNITDIRVVGKFAFLSSYSNSSGGFKVWDISNSVNINSINLSFNFGNKPVVIDYEGDFVYAVSESTPNLQILYSPPI